MTNQWEVNEGDLVIKRGEHEAHVYFVECIDRVFGDYGDVSSILLVDGTKDVFYEDYFIDDFFAEYRLLASKNNLEIENQLYTVTLGCNDDGRVTTLMKLGDDVLACLCDEIAEDNMLTESEIKNSQYNYLFDIAEKVE